MGKARRLQQGTYQIRSARGNAFGVRGSAVIGIIYALHRWCLSSSFCIPWEAAAQADAREQTSHVSSLASALCTRISGIFPRADGPGNVPRTAEVAWTLRAFFEGFNSQPQQSGIPARVDVISSARSIKRAGWLIHRRNEKSALRLVPPAERNPARPVTRSLLAGGAQVPLLRNATDFGAL